VKYCETCYWWHRSRDWKLQGACLEPSQVGTHLNVYGIAIEACPVTGCEYACDRWEERKGRE